MRCPQRYCYCLHSKSHCKLRTYLLTALVRAVPGICAVRCHISPPVLLLPDSANCSLVGLNQLVAIPHVQLFDAATCAGWAFLAICVAAVSPLLRLSSKTKHIRASSLSKPANESTVHCATSDRLPNGFFTATNSVTNARLHFSRSLHCNSQPNLPAKPRR
jgi:hypothetical protein